MTSAQLPAIQTDNSETASPTRTPTPTPIPIAAVLTEAEATAVKIRTAREKAKAAPEIEKIGSQLSGRSREITDKAGQTSQLLAEAPTLDQLRNEDREWRVFADLLSGWKEAIKARATAIDGELKTLAEMRELWERSLEIVVNGPEPGNDVPPGSSEGAPPEAIKSMRDTIASIKTAQSELESRRNQLLSLQSRIGELKDKVDSSLESVKDRREIALSNLFRQDAQPIWLIGSAADRNGDILAETNTSISPQVASLESYVLAHRGSFVLHAVLLAILTIGLYWVRRYIRISLREEERAVRAASVFKYPIAAALLISILFSSLLYPQPPRLLTAMLGAAAIVPAILLLRRMIDPSLQSLMNALVALFFVDRVREALAEMVMVSRLIFVGEMLAAIIFLVWFLTSRRLVDRVEAQEFRSFALMRRILPIAVAVFAIALIANLLGYVALSELIGNGVLRSAYAALFLYAAVEIFRSLFIFAQRVRPLAGLRMTKTNRALMRVKFTRALLWIAVPIWLTLVLNYFSIRDSVFEFLRGVTAAEIHIGSIGFTLGDVLIFVVAVWAAFLISRLIRFVLEEDVYPRIHLGSGLSYAVSTLVHYLILVSGILFAIASFGVDLSKFAILAGAVGIGVGFGLQNIINNFVSGLILLFERPVKVGDTVQIGDQFGELNQIGLRASVLRKVDGSDVILPNSMLISEEVTNWTMSDMRRRIDINVGVAYGSDADSVKDILKAAVTGMTDVMTDPGPAVMFTGFGDNSIDFQVRAWTENTDGWVGLRSDMVTSIYKALNEAAIEIPFPQRDIHVRSAEGLDGFKPPKKGKD